MQLLQVLIRPETNKTIIAYVDLVGRGNTIVVDSKNDPLVQQLIQQSQAKLPADKDNPAKDEVRQEISELEYRIAQLKKSIGVPA